MILQVNIWDAMIIHLYLGALVDISK